MGEEQDITSTDESPEKVRSGPGLIVWAILGVLAMAGGFAVPFVLPTPHSAGTIDEKSTPSSTNDSDPENLAFVPFGEVTVNLDEGRLNRYLRVSISLQIDKADEDSITLRLEQRKAMLRNWLLSHLSDKGMDDIRGASGQNRLRREILDHFNTSLFSDGYDRIHDVLFEEFNVQ